MMLAAIRCCMIVWPVAVFLILLVAAALDLYRRTPRDWVHWLGVGTLAVTYVINFAMQVYMEFFFQLPR